MAHKKFPEDPFQDIALTLSGGGYRSAAFNLGSMSYLQHISYGDQHLLEHVTTLSTVSGGTYPGLLYSAYLKAGKTFEQCYATLYHFMDEVNLVQEALNRLADDSQWPSGEKARNLANAFGKVYQERLFDGLENPTFDLFFQDHESHLEDVIFNATEFDKGLAFRFQKTLEDPSHKVHPGLIGNYFRRIPEMAAREIRLGDILLASSCFPAGFEPIGFPRDFLYPGARNLEALTHPELLKQRNFPELEHNNRESNGSHSAHYLYEQPMALMDGGIVDNQGIYGVLLAQERRTKHKDPSALSPNPQVDTGNHGLELMIISDVASHFMDPLPFAQAELPEEIGKISYQSAKDKVEQFVKLVRRLGIPLAILIAAAIVTLVLSVLAYRETGGFDRGSFVVLMTATAVLWTLSIAGGLALGILHALIGRIRRTTQEYQKQFSAYAKAHDLSFYLPFLHSFTDLKVSVIEPMTKDRFHSTIKMVNEVFLKQVRRLIYGEVYRHPQWTFRRISNLIYELTEEGVEARRDRLQELQEKMLKQTESERGHLYSEDLVVPGEKIVTVAQSAFSMGTTLWFTPEDRGKEGNGKRRDKLKDLIVCGQFTMCFNLLEYLWKLQTQVEDYQGSPYREQLDQLHEDLLADWDRFQENPFWLFEEIGIGK